MQEDFSADKFGLKIHISKLMNLGAKNFFVLGNSGEHDSLNFENEVAVLREAVSASRGKANILAGCFDKTSDGIIDKVNLADRQGVSACAVNVPVTALTNEISFMDYFEELFNQTKVDLFLYNNPFSFKRNIPIRGLEKIASWEKLLGIIDASESYEYFREIANFRQSMKIFQEAELLAFDSLRLNISGLVPVTANIYPSLFFEMISDFRKMDLHGMVRKQSRINSSYKETITKGKEIQSVKYILATKGIMQPYHSEKPEPLTEKEKEKLDSFVKTIA
jgi:dihydrodipicolinate synthase/N-acetylneuraminate lyase